MISIVVPVYNVEKYLRQCVDSVLAQTYSDWELILVDDGSPDSCPRICDEYAAKDTRIKVIHKNNEGLSSARNAGIKNACGEYITFIDSDDLIHRNYLDILFSTLTRSQADMACIDFCDHHNKLKCSNCCIYIFSGVEFSEKLLYQQYRYCSHSACGKLYKKQLIKNDFYKIGVGYEDLDAFYRLFPGVSKIAYTPDKLYYYRLNSNSYLHSFNEGRKDVLDITDKMIIFFGKDAENYNPRLYAAARDRRLSAHFNILGLMAANNFEDKSLEDRCWNVIKKERMSSLVNPKVRLKNKLGIIVSFFGKSVYKSVAKIIYRD